MVYTLDGTDPTPLSTQYTEPIKVTETTTQPTAQRVVDSWMASTKGHRENILNPDFENLAVAFGTYNDAYKYYWVQEFTTYR